MSKYSNKDFQSGFKLPKEIIGIFTLLFIVCLYWLYQNIVWLIIFIIACVILLIIGFTLFSSNKFLKVLSIIFIIFLSTFEFLLISDYTYYNANFQKGIISGGKELFTQYINLLNPRRFLKKEIMYELNSEKKGNPFQIQSGSSINP